MVITASLFRPSSIAQARCSSLAPLTGVDHEPYSDRGLISVSLSPRKACERAQPASARSSDVPLGWQTGLNQILADDGDASGRVESPFTAAGAIAVTQTR